jgi:hypothetical protein
MKITYDASSVPTTIINHVFQLEIGHGEETEYVEVELEETKNQGEHSRFTLVDTGTVDEELFDAIQMSSDELTEKLIEELKKQKHRAPTMNLPR